MDPNRFGSNSVGVTAFLRQLPELSAKQLGVVIASHDDLDESEAEALSLELDRAPLAERSAVDKASRATYHQLKGRFREVGGRLASMSGDLALWQAARAIAFPEKLDEEQFDVAVAPFAAVGIDCRALSQMGLVEE